MSKTLTDTEKETLINILKTRFEANRHRHKDIEWSKVLVRLEANPDKLWSLNEMERTGGEPDVVNYDQDEDLYTFFDCTKESPKDRRSLCYDRAALDARKKFKPKNSALDMATEMGINLLNETQYKLLQSLDPVDTKTSSWIETPEKIRTLGGALFGDFRFDHTFIYHNGAESYYAARGFRGALSI
ncbi:DUF4256 domain-containing protein [Formosa haliotis]|uniref:DUF4256 domain-containing protein n=1 Tax=Formosa haliotis TaxID=1555194 RepID=UPI000825CCA9|nr:DUF4256 domain-containing protein [Formosa haliotis]